MEPQRRIRAAEDPAAEREADAVAARVTGALGPRPDLRTRDGRLPAPVADAVAAEIGPLPDIRVHDDALAADMAASVHARAVTAGTDIHLGAGEGGTEVLAHEAAHAALHPQPAPDVVHALFGRGTKKAAEPAFTDNPLYEAQAEPVFTKNALYEGPDVDVDALDEAPAAPTVKLLYSADHAARALKLSSVLSETAAAPIESEQPAAVPGLTTLAFWGHGDATRLCHKTSDEIVSIIKAWKRLNPGLSSVEIITCNARHFGAGSKDSFAHRVKVGLRKGIRSSTRNITVKGLPETVTGKKNAWSILLAEANTNSWVYVTAPGATDKELMKASGLITFEDFTKPDGSMGKRSFKGDIAERADKMLRAHPDRQWTMNYGYFKDLRKSLATV